MKYWFYKFIIAWALTSGEPYDPPDQYLKEDSFQQALSDCSCYYKLGINYRYTPNYVEVSTLRNFYKDIVCRFKKKRSFPPITDYQRFPTKDDVEDAMRFQVNLMEFYKIRAAIEPHIDYTPLMEDLKSRQKFYWLLHSGVQAFDYGGHFEFEARETLLELRNILGYDNYYKGIIPTPVDLSTLKVLD